MHCMKKYLNSRGLDRGPSRRTFRLRRGFTLIEMLIVTVILSVISLAIYSSFASGMRIWKRLSAPSESEDQVVFFDRLGHDLRNAVKISGTALSGSEDQVEFLLLADSKAMGIRTVSRAGYAYEADSGSIKRWLQDYSAMFTGLEPGKRIVLSGVSQAKFSYYFFKQDEKSYAWIDRWSNVNLPLAVRVELEFDRSHGGGNVSRTFSIPVGSVEKNAN